MAITNLKMNKKKGYAILFAIIIISAISVVTAGLLNASYKQKILSSLASDSQIAFYQADKGAECALYLDRATNFLENENFTSWNCGGIALMVDGGEGGYKILPQIIPNATEAYFEIYIEKSETKTMIISNGYNIKASNPRAVQRTIQIDYQDI